MIAPQPIATAFIGMGCIIGNILTITLDSAIKPSPEQSPASKARVCSPAPVRQIPGQFRPQPVKRQKMPASETIPAGAGWQKAGSGGEPMPG